MGKRKRDIKIVLLIYYLSSVTLVEFNRIIVAPEERNGSQLFQSLTWAA